MWSALTVDSQVCVVIVLILMVCLMSGIIGYRMGWMRCVEYTERYIDTLREEYEKEGGLGWD